MKIFIGCASSDDISKKYIEDCIDYLKIVLKDNDLVFGADNKGLMGISYDIVKNYNGKIIGICPKKYKEDFKKIECDYEFITNSINERTSLLIDKSDASIFLPGGIGTMYELLSFIENKRFHEFDKPIVIYNSNHYFDDLLNILKKIYKDKFTSEKVSKCYYISYSAEDTLNYIKKYRRGEI